MIRFAPPDISRPEFLAFRDCIGRGAARQDIYGESTGGFGARQGRARASNESDGTLDALANIEFARIESHYRNLVMLVDSHYGVAGRRVLDFGCGTGALSVALALAGAADVTALDPTAASLQAVMHRAAYFGVADRVRTVLCAPSPSVPLRRGSFDLVITNSVLEFIPEGREAYVRELIGLLRPGGHLVVSTENGLFPIDYYTRMSLPRLRRARARRLNLPYGSTWSELHRWGCSGGARDLSAENRFNSLDKVSAGLRRTRWPFAASVLTWLNRGFRAACRALAIPSDVFLPYSTFVFQRDESTRASAATPVPKLASAA